MARKTDAWNKVKNNILDALDIVSEYRNLGLDVTGTPSSASEWIDCRCFGEDDRNPSAGINVSYSSNRGRYKNFKTGENLSFFDFVVEKANAAPNFFSALEIYAQKTGITLPKNKHCSQNISVQRFVPALTVSWFNKKPPITQDSFIRNGGQIVKEKDNIYVGLPIFGTIIDPTCVIGWVVWDRLGNDIIANKKPVKMKTVSGSDSGLMGLHGLQNINKAKYVWFTEGPTDMLALDSCIPEELRSVHVVITHSGGAMENPKDWEIEFFKQKNVIILSDADEAGVGGAKKWANFITKIAKTTKIVTLPYETTKSHGKDIRDFLNEGHKFQELIDLYENAVIIEPKTSESLLTELGEIDPVSGKVVLSTNHTLPTAKAFIKQYYTHDNFEILKYQNGIFYAWKNNAYRPVEDDYLKQQVQYFLHNAVTQTTSRNEVFSNPFPAKDTTIRSAIEAIKNVALLPSDLPAPHWMGSEPCPVNDPKMVIFGKTKNLDMETMKLFDTSPKWFNYNALDFDYDPKKRHPAKWDMFMYDLFGNDSESYQTLMQFIGLLLTPITRYQKALFIVGPKRSGKGTISKIIQRLVGHQNCCAPTTMGLADRFGLETLIGKTVSITSDSRFSRHTAQPVIERILNVTGEDFVSIERKYQKTISMRLPTRMIFLSNELPYFPDSSNAITSRFILLKLTKSFYDKPNLNLENELSEELPEILNSAVFWFHELIKQGYFIQPKSAMEDIEIMEDMGSPIGRFVKERCKVEEGIWIANDDLWNEWKSWCDLEGMNYGGRIWFFRNLKAALPTITLKYGTDNSGLRFKYYDGIGLNIAF
jgi:putative DNA primase/helicase